MASDLVVLHTKCSLHLPKRSRQRALRDKRTQLFCAARSSARSSTTVQASRRSLTGTDKYTFRTAQGLRILSTVEKMQNGFTVTINVPGDQDIGHQAALVWGLFRSSTAKWFNPEDVTPHGSSSSRTGRGLVSGLQWGAFGSREIQFWIPEELAPVFLAFQLEVANTDGEPVHQGPARGLQHFAVPVGLGKGDPLKYGASLAAESADGDSYSLNFAVVSRHANAMSLIIARRGSDGSSSGFLEIALDPLVNRTGDIWHTRLDGLKDLGSLCWGWRADAHVSWDLGNRFHPGQIMLDPYAPVATAVLFPEGVNVPPPKKGLKAETTAGANPPALVGCLSFLVDSFDWEASERPNTPLEDTLVLEVDIPSFDGGPGSSIPADQQGKYLSVLAALPQIKATGATAVMLTPVTVGGAGLGPFNRAPYSFFAPEIDFASGPYTDSAVWELRSLVKGLHEAGIEVYLQVEYCLTGEGWDEDASAVSLRGLDAAVYYRAKGVLNCGHANVRALILDSLRHWACYYQLDGFCFVNAETLTLDRDGTVLDNPALAEEIANDSELRQLKLIAWAADDSLLPRGGQRGFPHWAIWLERNKRFSADFKSFFTGRGGPSIASSIATRICGSPDLFRPQWGEGLPGGLATGRRAAFGLNSSSYLDNANLAATVSSILPPNAPFGQDQTLARSLLFATIMCQGTPIVGADVLEDSALAELVGKLWQLRRRLAYLLHPITFDVDPDLRWFGADPGTLPSLSRRSGGSTTRKVERRDVHQPPYCEDTAWSAPCRQPDWTGDMAASGVPGAAYLAFSVFGTTASAVYIAYNPYEGLVPAILPQPPLGWQQKGGTWVPPLISLARQRAPGFSSLSRWSPKAHPTTRIQKSGSSVTDTKRTQWKRAVDTSDSRQTALPEEHWIPLSAPDYTLAAKAALLLVGEPAQQASPVAATRNDPKAAHPPFGGAG